MENWQQILRRSVTTVDDLVERFGEENIDREEVQRAIDRFNLRITPAALQFIRKPGDPFWNQYVPSARENVVEDGIVDSLAEDADSPVTNLTHRYPDRVLFLVSPVCASYCRFCTRRRKVGDPEKIPLNHYDDAFAYLRERTEVRDVVLSGGDPLLLSDRRIEYLLSNLRAIPHLEILRIHSRVPSHLPERITPELCAILRRHHPLYINLHFDHPDELTPAAEAAVAMLADTGAPLGSQTVLLKGVNDDPEVMKQLMQKLLRNRIRPYYIYQADVVAGGEHFRTSVDKGLQIVKALRGWTSGLCVPHYVIDAPGGGGKIPLLPEYVESVTDEEIVLRNYAGNVYRYPLPRELVPLQNGRGNGNGRSNGNGSGRQNGKPGRRARVTVTASGNGDGRRNGNGHGRKVGKAGREKINGRAGNGHGGGCGSLEGVDLVRPEELALLPVDI